MLFEHLETTLSSSERPWSLSGALQCARAVPLEPHGEPYGASKGVDLLGIYMVFSLSAFMMRFACLLDCATVRVQGKSVENALEITFH